MTGNLLRTTVERPTEEASNRRDRRELVREHEAESAHQARFVADGRARDACCRQVATNAAPDRLAEEV